MSKIIESAHAAIGAAIGVSGPNTEAGDLISGIVSIMVTQRGWGAAESARLAERMLCDVVHMIGVGGARNALNKIAARLPS